MSIITYNGSHVAVLAVVDPPSSYRTFYFNLSIVITRLKYIF